METKVTIEIWADESFTVAWESEYRGTRTFRLGLTMPLEIPDKVIKGIQEIVKDMKNSKLEGCINHYDYTPVKVSLVLPAELFEERLLRNINKES